MRLVKSGLKMDDNNIKLQQHVAKYKSKTWLEMKLFD